MRHVARLVSVLVLLSALAACGGSSGAPNAASASPSTSQSPTQPASSNLDAIQVTGGQDAAPKVDFPSPFSVDKTLTKVLAPGDGSAVSEGSTVLLDYVGINGRDGHLFDSSWNRGAAQTFPLVSGHMMPGLLDGLVGQRVGSQLLIAIPPASGFGAQGNLQAGIQPTDSLLFAVHVRAVSDPHPLAVATGSTSQLPAGVPRLETDADGVPTGFSVAGSASKAPKQLGVFPVVRGKGQLVAEGDLVTVQYVAQIYPDGQVFDNSWARNQPLTVRLGDESLLKGWNQGIIGQRVGSRVVLVIPPDLGYGAQGSPPTIPANSSLIFSVDILGVG